jgi:hypothetical protein
MRLGQLPGRAPQGLRLERGAGFRFAGLGPGSFFSGEKLAAGEASPATMSTRPVQALEKPLPQNIEAERAVLGAILVSNDYIDTVMQRINSGDFWDRDHQIIFNTMLLLRGEQRWRRRESR